MAFPGFLLVKSCLKCFNNSYLIIVLHTLEWGLWEIKGTLAHCFYLH